MVLFYLLAAIIVGAILSSEYYIFRTGVPTVASFPATRRKIVELLQRYVPKDMAQPATIIDLGSGNGQLATLIAKEMPDAHVIGIEISPFPWLFSVLRQKLFGPRHLSFRRVDFWPYDCATADVIMVFLTENIIDRVSEKLRRELKSGALVIANEAPLSGDWHPIAAEDVDLHFMKMKPKIFVYRQA